MNKYYTPEIEEFYVGFEYEEYLKSEGKWNWECQEVEEVYEFTYYKDQINADNIRVKYLDKEDIESLGFKKRELPYQYFKDTYMLVDLGANKYCINQPNLYDDSEFRGFIKNKSELKKLLKRLDIL